MKKHVEMYLAHEIENVCEMYNKYINISGNLMKNTKYKLQNDNLYQKIEVRGFVFFDNDDFEI